ncbi:dTMP kinase [Myxococcota bacterium]|nr:dTMP kinase [Myxococcota bacterium]
MGPAPLALSLGAPAGRGTFVVIEGIDGCGSTTQAQRLRTWIESRGGRAFVTHEPTQGPVGMLIRLALQGRLMGASYAVHNAADAAAVTAAAGPLDERTLALLFAADRVDHVQTEVRPQLAAGAHVVSDRYLLSSLAYQGDRLPLDWVRSINAGAPPADLTVYLDVDLDAALARLRASRWSRELTEEAGLLSRVLDRYRSLAASGDPALGPVRVVDGRGSPDEVHAAVVAHVFPLLI